MNRAGSRLQLLDPEAVAVDPGLEVAVGRARDADPDRARGPCRGRRMTRASSAKYLPPNWAPIPLRARQLHDLVLERRVAKRLAQRVPLVGRWSR